MRTGQPLAAAVVAGKCSTPPGGVTAATRGRRPRLPEPYLANLSGVVHGGYPALVRDEARWSPTARGSFRPNTRFVDEIAAGVRTARS